MTNYYKNEFDVNVLREVAERPVLWDIKTEEYKDSEKKPAVWLEIAEKLGTTPGTYRLLALLLLLLLSLSNYHL